MVSSLIGTAASALPLFKSGAGSGGGGVSRSLADGAPSKQPYYSGGATVSRSTSAHSDARSEGEATLWGGRAVQLADDASVLSGNRVKGGGVLKEPKDEGARKRYEALFDKLLAQQKETTTRTAPNSNASTVRESHAERKASGGVQALKGWFESDPASSSTANPSTPSKSEESAQSALVLLPKTVRKVWTRSRLPSAFLAQIWDRAVSQSGEGGCTRGTFVRAMAGIDVELERKKQRREIRRQRRTANSKVGSRRVPPPPPSQS